MGFPRYLVPVLLFFIIFFAIGLMSSIRSTYSKLLSLSKGECCDSLPEDVYKTLKYSNQPITFLTPSIKSKGKEFSVPIAIRSNISENATFEIQGGFSCRPPLGAPKNETPTFHSYNNRTIQPRSSVILPINIKTPSTLTPGTYTCAIDLYFTSIGDRTLPTPQLYASKGFEVLVLDRNR